MTVSNKIATFATDLDASTSTVSNTIGFFVDVVGGVAATSNKIGGLLDIPVASIGPIFDTFTGIPNNSRVGPIFDHVTETVGLDVAGPVTDSFVMSPATDKFGPVMDHIVESIPAPVTLTDPDPVDADPIRNVLVAKIVETLSPGAYGFEADVDGTLRGARY